MFKKTEKNDNFTEDFEFTHSQSGRNIISGSIVETKLTTYKMIIVRYNKKTNICECIDTNNKIEYLHKNFLDI